MLAFVSIFLYLLRIADPEWLKRSLAKSTPPKKKTVYIHTYMSTSIHKGG